MREIDLVTLEACRRGDRAAFRVLVETYQDAVHAFAVALVDADAADVTQETFVRAHAAVRRFEPGGPAKLSTWLLTIARRLCRERRRRARLVPLTPELAGSDPGDDPERRLIAARVVERVRVAFERLPDEQRAVVALRSWDGLEYEEIAAVEGVPVGTVRSRLARARAALAEALADIVDAKGERHAAR